MKITLKSLSIVNFKGIQNINIDFNHVTNIFGENATGKTSVFDAFLWMFFGKNSEYVSQFEVKRLDEENKFIKDLESEVSAIIMIDQQEVSVKKVLRQKWVRKRGQLDSEYQGDENIYYWNDVPLKESEFKAKIKGIVDELLFKLITNPFHFNSLKWQDRRNTLVDIAGNITNEEVIGSVVNGTNKEQFNALITALSQGKTIDEFKSELAAKKRKIKDEADPIPSRIDEVRRGMPEELNFDSLKSDLANAESQLKTTQGTMSNEIAMQQEENKRRAEILKNHNLAIQQKQQKSFNLKTQMQNIEFEVKQQAREKSGQIEAEINSLKRQLGDKEADFKKYERSVAGFESDVNDKESHLNKLRTEYESIDGSHLEFNENEFSCPSCHQSLPTTNIEAKKEELTSNFNKSKLQKLEAITKEAMTVKGEVETLKARVTSGKDLIVTVSCEVDQLKASVITLAEQASGDKQDINDIVKSLLSEHLQYQQLVSDLTVNEPITIEEPVFEEMISNTELKFKESQLNDQINLIKKELAKEELIAKGKARIIELEQQENRLAQELADMEGSEYAILQFTKAKVDAIERRINGKFKFVKFKMFNLQNNGGEQECCDTLIDGVPFSDANNAAKVNAGIDIINTLCKHYNVYAPIFIDNRESVSNLIDSDSQIVNLIVSSSDKMLRVA